MAKKSTFPRAGVEYRTADTNFGLVRDLVRHVHERCELGPVLIVAERPVIFLSVFRKQWMKYGRLLQIERARTMQPEKLVVVLAGITRVYESTFSASDNLPPVDIQLIDPQSLVAVPDRFVTVYFCHATPQARYDEILQNTTHTNAVAVDYATSPAARIQ